ncbi:MAG: hypothetical protein J07HX64_01549 [halophilic archaeon J07HX64]|nr:MAG: hypothetical protein J07HX64_01549 [halophilic archaeon J07HX64]
MTTCRRQGTTGREGLESEAVREQLEDLGYV